MGASVCPHRRQNDNLSFFYRGPPLQGILIDAVDYGNHQVRILFMDHMSISWKQNHFTIMVVCNHGCIIQNFELILHIDPCQINRSELRGAAEAFILSNQHANRDIGKRGKGIIFAENACPEEGSQPPRTMPYTGTL